MNCAPCRAGNPGARTCASHCAGGSTSVGVRYPRVSCVVVYAEFRRNAAGKVCEWEMRDPFRTGRTTQI